MTRFDCLIDLHFSSFGLKICFTTPPIQGSTTYSLLISAFAELATLTEFREEVRGCRLEARVICPFFYRYYL